MIEIKTSVHVYSSFGSGLEPVLKGIVIGYGSICPSYVIKNLDDKNDYFVYLVKPIANDRSGLSVHVEPSETDVVALGIIAVPRDRIKIIPS